MIPAIRTQARLSWLLLKRRRLIWICAILALLPALGSIVLLIEGNGGRDLYDNLLQVYFAFMLPFLPTLLLASAVGEEIESRTSTFVFARPAPRITLVIGRFLAATAAAMAIVAAALALSWGLSLLRLSTEFWPEVLHFLRSELGAMLGLAAFGALAVTLGTLWVKHPLVASLIYLLVVEWWIGSRPLIINVMALSWHLRNLADLGQPSNFGPTAHLSPLISAAILVAVVPLLLLVAGEKLKRAE